MSRKSVNKTIKKGTNKRKDSKQLAYFIDINHFNYKNFLLCNHPFMVNAEFSLVLIM